MSNLGRQIEAFRAVMITGGMTTAAEALRITQPAVSRLIRDLELDMEIRLFHRRGNQITPSVEATAFLAEVERAYLGLDQLKAYAGELRRSLTGSLRIAALPAMALGFLPYCLGEFSRERPKVSLHLDGFPSHLVLERVMGGQFELGFAELPSHRPMLDLVPMTAPAVVVLPPGHSLGKHERLSVDDLKNEQIIMPARGSYMRYMIEQALSGNGDRTRLMETPLSSIACAMVMQGLGICIVEPFTAVGFVKQGAIARPLEPSLKVGFALLSAQHRPLSQIGQEFIDQIQIFGDNYLAPIFEPGTLKTNSAT